jgi:hypothetical protein
MCGLLYYLPIGIGSFVGFVQDKCHHLKKLKMRELVAVQCPLDGMTLAISLGAIR